MVASTLRIVTYNIHGQRDNRAALARVVRAEAPDIAIVQEGPRRLWWRHRRAELARRWGMFVVDGGEPAAGNVLLAGMRVRVHDTRCLLFPLHFGRHLRGAVVARCTVGVVPFLVCGTHLALDQAERCAQVRRLRAELAPADDRYGVIIGGDLNETSERPAWRILADGLVDAGGDDLTPTFPTRVPQHRIDALFVGASCQIRGYRVVDTPASRAASDHFPVLVDLVLPPAADGSDGCE